MQLSSGPRSLKLNPFFERPFVHNNWQHWGKHPVLLAIWSDYLINLWIGLRADVSSDLIVQVVEIMRWLLLFELARSGLEAFQRVFYGLGHVQRLGDAFNCFNPAFSSTSVAASHRLLPKCSRTVAFAVSLALIGCSERLRFDASPFGQHRHGSGVVFREDKNKTSSMLSCLRLRPSSPAWRVILACQSQTKLFIFGLVPLLGGC